ncbi:MAG: carboxymuconolactone decarboxylase family protein [Dehalococcoidia bacterium]|nr:carboxymuconolactone decarboxylase family protein [Dehalococcoidia bacterium]
MAVIPPIEDPQTDELRERYERLDAASGGLGVLNVFKVMAHNPQLLRAWLRMATMLLTPQLALSPRLRELAILRVFQNTGGEYGFAHHVRIGRQAGLTEDEIAGLKGYEGSAQFSDADRLALRYTDAVTALSGEAPALARALLGTLSQQELVELTFCAAHWNMVARFLQPLEIELDEPLTRELPAGWRRWM